MKKLISSISVLALVGLSVAVAVGAAETSVTATVTVENIAISIDDGTVTYGVLLADTSEDTITLTDTQTVTNDGNVSVDLDIKGKDSASWTLSATNAGTDNYVHKFCSATCDSPPTNYAALTTSYQDLANGVSAPGTQDFDLEITTPATSTNFDSQSVDVTVLATAAS